MAPKGGSIGKKGAKTPKMHGLGHRLVAKTALKADAPTTEGKGKGKGKGKAKGKGKEAADTANNEKKATKPGKTQTWQEKQAKHKVLMDKVDEFKQKLQKLGKDVGKPRLDLLKSSFTSTQMSSLWQLLAKERKGKEPNIQEAWDDICGMKTGSEAIKQAVLIDMLTLEGAQWASLLLKRSTKLSMSTGWKEKARPLTR